MDINDMFNKAFEEALRERGHVNILTAGRTGVGKSTLINAVFQGNFATTGQGRPVTESTREYTKEGIPLTIIDTRGLEMKGFARTLGELESTIAFRCKQSAERHVHVAWLCIQEDGRRVEDAEIQLSEMLGRHVPVIGVITKSRSDQGFRAVVQRLLPQTSDVVRVRALREELDDGHVMESMGLEDLVEVTFQHVPAGQRRAFVAAQKVSVEKKKKEGHAIVLAASITAAGIAATPIPFADAVLLVPVQIGMLARISAAFGLNLSVAYLTTLVTAAVGGTATTLAGRMLVATLLKFVPVGGPVVGGMIAAATATALTVAVVTPHVLPKSGPESPQGPA